MLGFVLAEAVRDLRRAGRMAVSAVLLITLSLIALGGFWLLGANLGQAVAEWRQRVRIIVYLKREPTDVSGLLERIRAVPDVATARYVSKAEALQSLKRVLGKDAPVTESLPTNPLPASIEITPAPAATTPERTRALLTRLAALPETDEIEGGVEWVERLADWQRLLLTIGLGLGATLALAAILAVTTSTRLVLHARRRETEIMRLVGAPESAIRLPLLAQGMIQGLVSAVLALGVLLVAHRLGAPRLEPLLSLTVGLPRLEFLALPAIATLMLAGTALGGVGGWMARGRGPA